MLEIGRVVVPSTEMAKTWGKEAGGGIWDMEANLDFLLGHDTPNRCQGGRLM
jgi:hypothetical protein